MFKALGCSGSKQVSGKCYSLNLFPSNCKRISLSLVMGKLLETLIQDMINGYREEIGVNQHKFVKDKLFLTNLMEFLDVVMNRVDEDNAANMVYMGFLKTFNKRLHNRLYYQSCVMWLKRRDMKIAKKQAKLVKVNGYFSE